MTGNFSWYFRYVQTRRYPRQGCFVLSCWIRDNNSWFAWRRLLCRFTNRSFNSMVNPAIVSLSFRFCVLIAHGHAPLRPLKQFGSIRKQLIPPFAAHPLRDPMLIAQFAAPALSFQPLKHYRELFPACPLFFSRPWSLLSGNSLDLADLSMGTLYTLFKLFNRDILEYYTNSFLTLSEKYSIIFRGSARGAGSIIF